MEQLLFDLLAPNYNKTMALNKQHFALQKHLERICCDLEYSNVLDVGIGTGHGIDGYIKNSVKTIYGIDSSSQMLEILRRERADERIRILNEEIEAVDLENLSFDLAVFSFSLSWLKKPEESLEKVCKKNPDYVIIAEQVFEEGEETNIGKGHPQKDLIVSSYNPLSPDEVDGMIEKNSYFPLIVLKDRLQDVEGNPSGKLRTVLYTKTKPDNTPYESAAVIFQVNTYCNKDCVGCYFDRTARNLDLKKFNEQLAALSAGDLITLRGGEPTLNKKLFEEYMEPALKKGLKIILETNGYFISTPYYQQYLGKLADNKIAVRLSFDERHLEGLSAEQRKNEFQKMAMFAKDAAEQGIEFNFYALGMDKKQVKKMVSGTLLEGLTGKFYSLTFYDDINDVELSGSYIAVDGTMQKQLK